MLFKYEAVTRDGQVKTGDVEAVNQDVAIGALQKRGLVVSEIKPAVGGDWFSKASSWRSVSAKEIVMLSRQMATLFESRVSALRIFRLLAEEVGNPTLQQILTEVADDVQAGSSVSDALARHPAVFSDFYVSMVKTGEESGRLNEVLNHLSDYLDRTYELTSKAKHALIYPSVVVVVFLTVMILMFTVIIPQIAGIIEETGQDLPIYTIAVLSISGFLVSYGLWLIAGLVAGGIVLARWIQTRGGKRVFDRVVIETPYLGDVFRKLYLARIADNLNTMVGSGISSVRALEVTAAVVGNDIYREILFEAREAVKGGQSMSEAFSHHPEIPAVMVQMAKVGEETGSLGKILKTLSDFYQREFSTAVDTIISLIEPAMIVLLGLGVGVLLASVLMPIYNLTGAGI